MPPHPNRDKAPPPRLLRGHRGGMAFVAFLSDDQVISASDVDGTLRRWNLSDGKNEVLKEVVVCTAATSPNGRWVAIGGRDGKVRLLDPRTPTEAIKSNERHEDAIRSLSFSPDLSHLASGAQDGNMCVWSLRNLDRVAGPFGGYSDSVWCVCYSPDGKKIASCDREVIQIWDSSSWVATTIHENAWSLAWSPDGDSVFAGCIDGAIKRFNPSTGLLLATYNGHSDAVFSIAVSHNAKFLATASWDKTVRLWEAETFHPVGPTLLHDAKVHSISISPDNGRLVSGARDTHIRVWDLRLAAPALFRTFLLEPNRPHPSGRMRFQLPRLFGPGPSDAPDHDDSFDFHGETNRGPTESNIPIIRVTRQREQIDMTDDPRIPGLSTQPSGSGRTDNLLQAYSPSSISFHHPVVAPPQVPRLDVRHVTAVDSSRSPDQLKTPLSASDDGHFIRQIRSDKTYDLTGMIKAESNNPVTGGSHGDIYRGELHKNGQVMTVAIKVIKKYMSQGDDISKERRLRREIDLWVKLDHRNVLPMLGTTKDYGDFPAMVCPWLGNGCLTHFLDRQGNNITPQLRFGIINDVALGLQYLHSGSIVHGDISGSNVLIHDSGRACIADFGLSMIENDLGSRALTYQVKGTLRYTAPELLQLPRNDREETSIVFPTMRSDIYSFGGIMFQVLTGEVPYHHLQWDTQVLLAISQGERPRRHRSATIVTDDLWEFMMECWAITPTDRPSDIVTFVHDQLLSVVCYRQS